MNPGELDRRIALRKPVITRDAMGGEIRRHETAATVWARFIPLAARERFLAQGVHSEREGKFKIRFRTDVSEDWQIQFDGMDWEIVGFAPLGRREAIEITARAIK